jgi:hypothetical protein
MTEIQTKFEGEIRQFTSKLERLSGYLDVVQRSLRPKDVDASRFLIETVVVMMVAFLDHFLRSVIGTATYAREVDARVYLAKKGNEADRKLAASCTVKHLRAVMSRRASLVGKRSDLEVTFQFLLGFSVWPDDPRQASLIRDLARLRHLIVHEGGYPERAHFEQMEVAGLITEASQELGFYRMNLVTAAPIVKEGIEAVNVLVTRFQERVLADDRWKWRGPLEQLPQSITEGDLS